MFPLSMSISLVQIRHSYLIKRERERERKGERKRGRERERGRAILSLVQKSTPSMTYNSVCVQVSRCSVPVLITSL